MKNRRCYLCLKLGSDDDPLAECSRCGRTYHKSCSGRIKKCAMCGEPLIRDGGG